MAEKKSISARIFNVMQYKEHPITKESLIDEEIIKSAVNHKVVDRYAYVLHDNDKYVADDEQREYEQFKALFNCLHCYGDFKEMSAERYEVERTARLKAIFDVRDKAYIEGIISEFVKAKSVDNLYQKYRRIFANDIKPEHFHIVLSCPNKARLCDVARWFNVAECFVDIPKGKGAFMDCVKYLTHEDKKQQDKGKYLYADDKITANFDFRSEIANIEVKRAVFGRDVSEKEEIRHRVLIDGLSIRQLVSENPLAYENDSATLDKYRFKYINDFMPLPPWRINFYICGSGGIGKDVMCRAIARQLSSSLLNINSEYDDDIFFEVGAKGSAFQGYDGQQIIIWSDRRACDLLEELHGRGNVFNVFDNHPKRIRQNVKYGSVTLCNSINIVNSVQPWDEFLEGLTAEYKDKTTGSLHKSEDKSQSQRRFPIIIPLREEDFDIMLNKGFFEGTREFEQYHIYKNIVGSGKRLMQIAPDINSDYHKTLCKAMLSPVIQKTLELAEKLKSDKNVDEDEFNAYLNKIGKINGVTSIEEEDSKTKKEIIIKIPTEENKEGKNILKLAKLLSELFAMSEVKEILKENRYPANNM